MPRIDPVQLLNCLSVLLSQNGGIKSGDEVPRLARLMTKFSKKLVSKCIYIQILKCTETELLRLFMGAGGWQLVHMWLMESIVARNWPLVRELLELLLLCPVDIERLKTNNCPKLVKELSKDGNHLAIRALASKLVEQWLKTVKGEVTVPIQAQDITKIIAEAQSEINNVIIKNENLENVEPTSIKIDTDFNNFKQDSDVDIILKNDKLEKSSDDNCISDDCKIVKEELDKTTDLLPVLKIKVKDGKQILTKVEDSYTNKLENSTDSPKSKENVRDKSKDRPREKSSSSSGSSSKSSSSKHSSRTSSDKHRSKSSNSSSSSSKDSKDKHSSSRDKSKDKVSSSSSKSKHDNSKKSERSSSSSSNKNRENHNRDETKSSEKDKVKDKTDKKEAKSDKKELKTDKKEVKTEKEINPPKVPDDKPQSPSIHKLGKIPKLSDLKKEKLSISIEVKKPDEPKPKTVKTFNSKFRKHGLEEEIKPPPSRASLMNKKVLPVLPPNIPIPKRPSPVHNESPPEKKPKTVDSPIEKPGSIKLIAPKAKPMLLLESDMFMDALNASATNKKEPKKRKRRTSGSKDGNSTNDNSPPNTPNSMTSPISESKSVPPRFYQDTLETDETKEKPSDTTENNIDESSNPEKDDEDKMETTESHTITVNGLKGVLCYHKKKGPKKSIKWKPESELEEIQYFELDETERVNVTKTFTDMKHLERINERDAFQKARNLSTDDIMEERTPWRPLILIEAEGQIQVEYGKNSKEKDIQAARQKGTLQPLYFHKSMIPDSAFEPDLETHIYSEPTIIPLDDITGNQDNVSDFRNMPWPEPKGNAPPPTSTVNVPNMFPPNMAQFPNGFPPAQFPGVPGFQSPMVPTDWPNGVPPMMPNGMGVPMAPGGFVPGAMPPGMIPPDSNMMMGPGPEMFPPNPMFPMPDGFNMQQNMFPMDFNMAGPQGPPPPEGFPGPQNYRGPPRGRGGGGGHWRGKTPGNWESNQRGRGGAPRGGVGRKNMCIYFQRKGSCRQGDKCTFLHPGVNCPY